MFDDLRNRYLGNRGLEIETTCMNTIQTDLRANVVEFYFKKASCTKYTLENVENSI